NLKNVSYTDSFEGDKMNPVTEPQLKPNDSKNLQDCKSYAFAFASNGKAELRIIGEYTREDLEDLKTHLEVTMRGLLRSKGNDA
ncbi:MAG TPA: hypothetical protein VG272_06500, partial [Candidatus Acidoferrales bacterium]|nr:hypothetical protein [Candidatus Acidoferrales bacterium]